MTKHLLEGWSIFKHHLRKHYLMDEQMDAVAKDSFFAGATFVMSLIKCNRDEEYIAKSLDELKEETDKFHKAFNKRNIKVN